jgi:hypothetical protein
MTRPMSRALSRIAMIALAGMALSAVESRAEVFRDWQTNCRVDGECRAVTGDTPRLIVERAAPDSAGWFVAIEFLANPTRTDRAIALTITGGPKLVLAANGGFRAFGKPGRFYVTDPTALEELLPAMLAGDDIRIDYFDVANEPRSADLSLSGLTASILWIEDQMGITGTPRNAVPPSGIPAAGPPDGNPVRDAGIPGVVRAYHERTSDCEIYDDRRLRELGSRIEPLTPTSILYALPCTAHAYNVTYRLYLRDIGEIGGIRTLYFADYSEDTAWSGTDLLFNISVEGDRLTAFYKGRGLGDCGTLGEWQWNRYDYRLLRYAVESECRGVQPEEWPVVFPPR